MRSEEHAFGFLVRPDGGAPPAVVMIPDVWGLSDFYRRLATRLAGDGFAVLAIDPYRKTGRGQFSDPAGALAWIRELPDALVLETIQEAIDVVGTAAKVGVTGFCMGGQYTLLAAARCRGVSACAPFYGMVRYDAGLDRGQKPSSPLEAARDIACPVLGFYGAEDPIIPVADVEELRVRLADSRQPFEVRLYPKAGHAFMNEDRREMYRAEAAGDAWPRLVAFFRERLG